MGCSGQDHLPDAKALADAINSDCVKGKVNGALGKEQFSDAGLQLRPENLAKYSAVTPKALTND